MSYFVFALHNYVICKEHLFYYSNHYALCLLHLFVCLFIALLWWLGHITVLSGKIGNLVLFPIQRKSFVLPWSILLTIGFLVLFIRLKELLCINNLQKVLSFHVELYQMYFYLFYDHIWSFLYYDKWIVLITSQVLKQSMFLEQIQLVIIFI